MFATVTTWVTIIALSVTSTFVQSASSSWRNSSQGIHSFMVFDSGLNDTGIQGAAQYTDFVWGGHHPTVWTAASPSTAVSQYIPYNRDPEASRTLSWWKANYPSWVIYRCDKVSPATIDPTDTNIPLDITNPDVVTWQVSNYAVPAKKAGFSALAVDNFDLQNDQGACGVWRHNMTQWVTLYNPSHASAYAQAQIRWLQSFHKSLKALGLLLIPNYCISTLPYNSSTALAVLSAVDGVLDERGYTGWGSGFIGQAEWQNVLGWSRVLQQNGKGYYVINEWGTSSKSPTFEARNWIVASYLCGNEGSSALWMGCIQCYGWYNPQPEYSLDIGMALGQADQQTNGVWQRVFQRGLVLLNPVGAVITNTSLQKGQEYEDSAGTQYSGSVTLQPGSGLVLIATKISD